MLHIGNCKVWWHIRLYCLCSGMPGVWLIWLELNGYWLYCVMVVGWGLCSDWIGLSQLSWGISACRISHPSSGTSRLI